MKLHKVQKNTILIYVLLGVVLLCTFLFFALSSITAEDRLKTGAGSFVFGTPKDKKEIRVWYYKPSTHRSTSQIVFVMHGIKRNGKKYRDSWVAHAKQGGFLLLAPEFSEKEYPGSAGYNLGNMFSSSGARNNEAIWSFTVIEELFDHIKVITKSEASGYSIYGHSAGAQFVHRFAIFKPKARIKTAIAANAGWYTMTTDEIAFPYGLKNSGKTMESAATFFDKDLILLLGDKDTDENHKYLKKSSNAMEQGRHRLERGNRFYQLAKNYANKQEIDFNWKINVVPNVAHHNVEMSAHAAKLLQ